jgi:hypothetical protein
MRVTLARWKEVNDRYVDALAEEVEGPLNERPDGMAGVLVSRGYGLDDRDNGSQWVVDRDSIGLDCVDVFLIPHTEIVDNDIVLVCVNVRQGLFAPTSVLTEYD